MIRCPIACVAGALLVVVGVWSGLTPRAHLRGPTGDVTAADAAGAPATVVVPPATPTLFLAPRNPSAYEYAPMLPFDFHFADRLYGSGFAPGEHVTVTAAHLSLRAIHVTADGSGAFAVDDDFVWRFCGPRAATGAPPEFSARGDAGSVAQFSLPPVPCPLLAAFSQAVAPSPAPTNSVAPPVGVGTAVVVGTVVAQPGGTAAAAPGTSAGPPPVASPAVPAPATFMVIGFGFAPGEGVAIHTDGFGSAPSPPPLRVRADTQGRLRFVFKASLPPICDAPSNPRLIATGDAGTSVVGSLFWMRPMVACPVTNPGGPPPPAVPHGAPHTPTADLLTIRLHPSTVQPGRMERATIQTDASGTVRLSIRYPGSRHFHVAIRADTAGRAAVRWRIPHGIRPGRARAGRLPARRHLRAGHLHDPLTAE